MTQPADKEVPKTGTDKHPPARPPKREHEGATEDEVAPTTPPVSPEYDDEPREGG